MMKLSDYFMFVDLNTKKVQGKFQLPPRDWKNISCFYNLSEEEMSDLGWADNPGLGFLRTSKIGPEYTCSEEHLDQVKLNIKRMSEDETKTLLAQGLTHNGMRFSLDKENIMFANFQNNRFSDKLKDIEDKWRIFTRSEMYELVESMNREFDAIIDSEIEFFQSVENCSNVYELSKLSYGF